MDQFASASFVFKETASNNLIWGMSQKVGKDGLVELQ